MHFTCQLYKLPRTDLRRPEPRHCAPSSPSCSCWGPWTSPKQPGRLHSRAVTAALRVCRLLQAHAVVAKRVMPVCGPLQRVARAGSPLLACLVGTTRWARHPKQEISFAVRLRSVSSCLLVLCAELNPLALYLNFLSFHNIAVHTRPIHKQKLHTG